jgi:hypothetical protein
MDSPQRWRSHQLFPISQRPWDPPQDLSVQLLPALLTLRLLRLLVGHSALAPSLASQPPPTLLGQRSPCGHPRSPATVVVALIVRGNAPPATTRPRVNRAQASTNEERRSHPRGTMARLPRRPRLLGRTTLPATTSSKLKAALASSPSPEPPIPSGLTRPTMPALCSLFLSLPSHPSLFPPFLISPTAPRSCRGPMPPRRKMLP